MAFSDDEDVAVPQTVSNYHFVIDTGKKDEPVSFSELPVQWNDREGLDGKGKEIFLHGLIDNGLQKFFQPVKAWKFDISDAKPEIWVLLKDNNWIKLQKPRKSYEGTVRTILITVHCLHSVKKNPGLSGKSLWDQLSKVFSTYEIRPSENDLVDHVQIISEAVQKDETLAKSKFLVTFLEERPQKKKALEEDIGTTDKFIDDRDDIEEFEEYDSSDEEDDQFDSVCAICDNGGDILCCEGRCLRSFHATVEAGSDSSCQSLGLTNEQVEAIQNFVCKNCQYKRHQCFICGELGSSDKSADAEVFPCVSATCGRFYHPRCVAKLLHRESAAEAEELRKRITRGESFTCPIHKCVICKQGENKMDPDLQFAVCRRCPKSYHRKCLPRKIAFEDDEDQGITQRAWEGLLPNQILIYCLKHEIDDELGTPIRKHIKFPDDGQKNKTQGSQKDKVMQKKRIQGAADAGRKSSPGKLQKVVDLPSTKEEDGSSKKSGRRLALPDSSKKRKVGDASIKPLNKSASTKVTKSIDENKPSLGVMMYELYHGKDSVSIKSRKEDTPDRERKQTPTDKPIAKEKDNVLILDDASKQRILALVKDAGSSITLENIIKNHKMPTTNDNSSRNVVDKTLTLGKVEQTVEAIREAIKKLEEGCSVEEAKLVVPLGVLNQIVKWKNKLGGYLSPFLNGARYTSFGRHFTKVDKLKEIVDLLHCYVQDGDMVVDFCCGSNDFSWLMKEKLDKIGTSCSYKNYDLVQAKNDFNFEKRDWMTVQPKELPPGSKLIMGLNPPFGKNARDANKFIDKALEFKPKLLILIAPPQTERLNKKDPPYDLIWEDGEMLAGKSFYLPGSVDVNDNQLEDWNMTTSLLNLWSRPDWTAKHKAIAQQHGHLSRLQEKTNSKTQREPMVSDKAVELDDLKGQNHVSINDHPVQNPARDARVLESHKEGDEREVRERSNSSHGKICSNEDSKNRERDKGKSGRESSKMSPAFKESGHSQERGRSPLLDKGKHGRESGKTSPAFKERGHSQERGRSPLLDKGKRGRESDKTSPASKERRKSRERGRSPLRDKGKRGRESGKTSPAFKERGQSQERELSPLSETFSKLPRLSPPIGSRRRSLEDGRSYEAPDFGNYTTGYGENRTDDSERGYSLRHVEHFPRGTREWSSGGSPSLDLDYGIRNPLEQYPGYPRDATDNHSRRPYVTELERKYAPDLAIRAQVPLYGQHQYPDTLGGQRSSGYLGGGDPGYPYDRMNNSTMQLGSSAGSSYNGMNTSAMQLGPSGGSSYDRTTTSATERYMPRLDEMNPVRVSPLAAVPAYTAGRNGNPGQLTQSGGYRFDPMSFGPGPYHPFSQHNPSGWPND